MRKLLATALVAPFLFAGVVAADDVEAFSPCGADLEHPVMASGESFTESFDGEESFSFYVDPTVEERGRVNVSAELTWENVLSDWDLGINDVLSENYQPLDPAYESATYSAKGDCKLVTVFTQPFDVWGTPPTLGMTLNVSVG